MSAAVCCARCGHLLTAERSVRAGLGPVCRARMLSAQVAERRAQVAGILDTVAARLDALAPDDLTACLELLLDVDALLRGAR